MLGEALDMHESSVYRTLKVLESSGFVNIETNRQWSVITICNYNAYQANEPNAEQQFEQRVVTGEQRGVSQRTTSGTQMNTKQQINNITNKQYIDRMFEEIWSDYPKKVGKEKAKGYFTTFIKNQKDVNKAMEEMRQALINYKNSKRVADGYVQDGKTWFNKHWKDWVTNPDSPNDPGLEAMRRAVDKL
jgi:hypothetical protein